MNYLSKEMFMTLSLKPVLLLLSGEICNFMLEIAFWQRLSVGHELFTLAWCFEKVANYVI